MPRGRHLPKTPPRSCERLSASSMNHQTKPRRTALLPRLKFAPGALTAILEEYRSVSRRPRFAGKNYAGLLSWIEKYALVVEPAPLGKGRSRDPQDDIFLACALSARANCIVSDDQDLLDLGKPFGIEIVRPAQFIARHKL